MSHELSGSGVVEDRTLTSRLATTYRQRILPKIRDRKGAFFLSRQLRKLATRDLPKYRGSPQSIFEAGNWKNLIILDACRLDLYEQVCGPTDSRVTLGSHSREFVEKTFSDRTAKNTVAVTGNPHYSDQKFENNTGKRPEDVFHTVFKSFKKGWDDSDGYVEPEQVAEDFRTARKLFPDKKIIGHFMQPHGPFIGFEGDNTPDRHEAEKGNEDSARVWKGYRQNLEYVLESVEDLLDDLEGRTVITADHGNLMGERGIYDHPYGLDTRVLREVPWDVRIE